MTATRARDLGIAIGALPTGPHNAITDVVGVRVGHATLVRGEGRLVPGTGPVRTGVTVVEPRPEVWRAPVYAGSHRLNGNGEMTGLAWVRESGLLTTSVGLTNTHSVGLVRDALVAEVTRARGHEEHYWVLPVVAETWDGVLNDVNGQHVTDSDVGAALSALAGGPVPEGAVGGGTGMVCHEFKGGIGTSSRVVAAASRSHTVGVLVQANHGRRHRLRVDGVPVGERVGRDVVPSPYDGPDRPPAGSGSIIVVVATDAPLLPHQCEGLAQRAVLGIGRTGGTGEHSSGDLVLAFATGNDGLAASALSEAGPDEVAVRTASSGVLDGLFDAVIEATEEAILNCLVAARTTVGRDGVTAHALPHDLLLAALGLPG